MRKVTIYSSVKVVEMLVDGVIKMYVGI